MRAAARAAVRASLLVLALAGPAGAQTTPGDTVTVAPDLVIGVTDGPDEYTFGLVAGIAEDERARILVGDLRLARIQVYDSLGRYVKSIGRRGQGPGELQRPVELAAPGHGTTVVTDLGFDAYLWFDEDGRPLARTRRPYGGPFVRDRIAGDGAGRLLDARRPGDRAYPSFPVLRFELGPADRLSVDSVLVPAVPETLVGGGAFGPGRPPFGYVRVPFAPLTTWAPIPGGVAYSRDGRYVIEATYFDGRVDTLVRRPDAVGSEIPAEVAATASRPIVQFFRSQAERLGMSPEPWVEALEMPSRFPPVVRLFPGSGGRVWVLSGGPRGRPVFDVWTADGTLLGSLVLDTGEWPDLDTLAVGPTHVLGRFELETGAQVVRGFPVPARLR